MHEGNNRVHVANLFNLYPKRVHKDSYIYFDLIFVYAVVIERRLPHSVLKYSFLGPTGICFILFFMH